MIPLRIIAHLERIFKEIDPDLDIPTWVDVFSSTSASTIFTGAMMLKVMDMDGLQVFPVYGKTGEVSGTAMIYLVRDDEDPPTKRVGVEVCVADMVQLLAKER